MSQGDRDVFFLGDVRLQSGAVLYDSTLAYRTFGKLNPRRDNVVLIPTYYTGTDADIAKMIGDGRALDPRRYFIVVFNMFGNGISTSPSNASPGCAGAQFPGVTVYDNVQCQHRLIREIWGIEQVALVMGWSMGAQQSYQWAVCFPEMVRSLLACCGSAKTSTHNQVFLEGVKAALTADAAFNGGDYTVAPEKGLKAFARVYAGWAYSQAFFRNGVYRELGFESAEALLQDWERDHLTWDANDLLAMLWTWQHADISENDQFNGDFDAALAAVRATTIVMPASTDLYFPPEDNAYEVDRMPNAELRVIDSVWGHIAGHPDPKKDAAASKFVDRAIGELLA